MHSVTSKLNKDARQHQGNNGTTFFVSLGEQSYNFKTKTKEWCNYDAALFAKDGQIQFYADVLKAGAIITVGCQGLLLEVDPSGTYPPKVVMQDAKLVFSDNSNVAPQQQAAPQQQQQQNYQQQAPQQNYQQQAPQQQQQNYQQQAPQQQQNYQAPQQAENFDDTIPF
jgi:succinyl-CoA synthetase beta subunit